MNAKLNLTSFLPEDFPRQTLRSKAGININLHGKFSINKNAQTVMGFKGEDKVLLFQNDEPHTAIWFIKLDKSGWPLRDSQVAGLHFSAKHLAKTIFEVFSIEDSTSFSFFLHEEPIEMEGAKYWILFSLDEELESFLQSIAQPEKRNPNMRGRKPGSKNKPKNQSIYGERT